MIWIVYEWAQGYWQPFNWFGSQEAATAAAHDLVAQGSRVLVQHPNGTRSRPWEGGK